MDKIEERRAHEVANRYRSGREAAEREETVPKSRRRLSGPKTSCAPQPSNAPLSWVEVAPEPEPEVPVMAALAVEAPAGDLVPATKTSGSTKSSAFGSFWIKHFEA
jgi:hypothetical protein